MNETTRKQVLEVAAKLRDPERVVLDPDSLFEKADGTPHDYRDSFGGNFRDGESFLIEEPPRACVIGWCSVVARTLAPTEVEDFVVGALGGTPTLQLRRLGGARIADKIEAAVAA